MQDLLYALAVSAMALSNFPRDAGGPIAHTAIAVELDGIPTVVVAAGNQIVAFRADGSMPPGFPFTLDAPVVGSPAAAEMAGDGRIEIAAATVSGRLYLFGGGGLVKGFPVKLATAFKAGPSFADVDGDGHPEILIGDSEGKVHALTRTGQELRGWPSSAASGHAVTTSVSSSNFAKGRAFAFGCEDGRVYVLDSAGKVKKGFPLKTSYTVSGAPAFGDLEDEGKVDLVVASQDYKVYAVDGDANVLPGFPVAADYRIYGGPVLADLEGQGHLDVVFTSADGFVHAVTRTGQPLPGFPVQAGDRLFGGPTVADLTRDGHLDVVAVDADGTAYAFDHLGHALPGFPESFGAEETRASPLLFDLSRQGTPAIFVGLPDGRLEALKVQRTSSEAPPGPALLPQPWPQEGKDAAGSGRYGPNPPSFRDLAVSPQRPTVTESLTAKFTAVWLDAKPGEQLSPPSIEWQKNGTSVPSLANLKQVPAGTARKGERWRFVLTGTTGKTFVSPEATVGDTPPGEATVALEPERPSRAGPAKAVIAAPAKDADGDQVSYRIEWLLDGVETGVTGDTFPAEKMRKGALLGARVVANDGELDGPPAVGVARIVNTPPGQPKITLEPREPSREERVKVHIVEAASDLDLDPVTYHFVWKVGGETLNLPTGTSALPAGSFKKHETIEVEVRAFDGSEEGLPVLAQVVARNTPPTSPTVAIAPAYPRKGDALRAVLTAASTDIDADPLSYRFAWKKNGTALNVSGDGREVRGEEVARGDRFEVSVVALDGESEGPAAGARVTVGNTPPEPPRIALEPARPKGGDTLSLKILEPAHDVDGDPVKLTIAWTREGHPTGTGAPTLPPSEFRKNERVRVTVTPSDGQDVGAPVTFEVKIDNARPSAPEVKLVPDRPVVTSPLDVVVTRPAIDPDGDDLTYSYRFIKDGIPVAFPDGTEASRRSPYWTRVARVPARELRKGQKWAVEVVANDGEANGPVARAETTIGNSAPPAPVIAFTSKVTRRMDGLSVSIEQAPDADGDHITHRFTWTRNGVKVDVPPDEGAIPRGVPRKGERWAVEVVAFDGEADSPAARAETVVADTAPGPAQISLCDGMVPAGTLLEVHLLKPSVDADGDAVTYRYAWTLNGKRLPAAFGQTKLTDPMLRKHDTVRVTVTPFDGGLAGPPAGAECRVKNTPPTVPVVVLEPREPSALTGTAVSVRRPSTDIDADPVSYHYAWSRNGIPVLFNGPIVPPEIMRHGETWQVVVTPYDGEEEGESVTLTTGVKNTPPPMPSVVLTPSTPSVGEPVTCDARAPLKDVDQEPITLNYQWFKDGKLQAISEGSSELPRGILRRGERWRCEAWASDGQGGLSPRGFAELLVRNSPPSSPAVVIEPSRVRRTHDMVCRIATASIDPDGDAVTYRYAWTRNGRTVARADAARVESALLRRGDRWRCTVTPSDGSAVGMPGVAEKVVLNSPPGPARVAIVPASPLPGQSLRCEVISPSEDPDGDEVQYKFRWQRNGAPQPFAETSQEVPSRLVHPAQRWRCMATPTDGPSDGPEAGSEEVTVSGAMPAPVVSRAPLAETP